MKVPFVLIFLATVMVMVTEGSPGSGSRGSFENGRMGHGTKGFVLPLRKRSGIADQKLAELETELAILRQWNMLRSFRDPTDSSAAFGLLDFTKM